MQLDGAVAVVPALLRRREPPDDERAAGRRRPSRSSVANAGGQTAAGRTTRRRPRRGTSAPGWSTTANTSPPCGVSHGTRRIVVEDGTRSAGRGSRRRRSRPSRSRFRPLGVGAAEPVGVGVASPSVAEGADEPADEADEPPEEEPDPDQLRDEADRGGVPGRAATSSGADVGAGAGSATAPGSGLIARSGARRSRRRCPLERPLRAGAATGRRSRAGRGSRRGRRPRRRGGRARRRAAPRVMAVSMPQARPREEAGLRDPRVVGREDVADGLHGEPRAVLASSSGVRAAVGLARA